MSETQVSTGSGIVHSSHAKAATVAFLGTGILVWICSNVVIHTLVAVLPGKASNALSGDAVRHGVPFVLGFGSFLFMQMNVGVRTWAEEVVAEIYRIVWPSRQETVARTIGVCIMVILAGIVLGLMDVISGSLIDWLLHQNFFGLF